MTEPQMHNPSSCANPLIRISTEIAAPRTPALMPTYQPLHAESHTHPGRVALVSMPFGPLFTPSIALGLLTSELRRAGFETETLYFTIPFAKRIGISLYELISSGAPESSLLLGDWLFRDALFGRASSLDDVEYMSVLEGAIEKRSSQCGTNDVRWKNWADVRVDLSKVRHCIDGFLDDCATAVLKHDPMLVGFTTVFQQNVASLAVSRRLKQISPKLKIVFGGANCESVMGAQLLASFPQIDYIVSGEGESALVEIAKTLSSPAAADSALPKTDREVISGSSAADMDSLGYPEYDSYFEQVEGVPEVKKRARILFESSRGCWWGERSHCTFCGLNGTNMRFRSKSASRAFTELRWLTSRYPDHPVSVVDNILDLKYFDSLVPMLQENPIPVELFYEVKANLKKRQLDQLKSANIRRVQPGIESLHDGVLAIMKKGVSAIQNIQLLKWCSELGIEPLWNLIWGFPGEDPDWYSEMEVLIPLLWHLPPPDSVSEIRLDRFSPLFDDVRLGALNKRQFPAYDYVYSELASDERFRLAYHFTFEYGDSRDVGAYTEGVRNQVLAWQNSFSQSAFFTITAGAQLVLCDMRNVDAVRLTLLDDFDSRLYQLCDLAQTADGAYRGLDDPTITLEECTARLQTLAETGVMIEIRGKYLSLAVEMNENIPNVSTLKRFQLFLQSNDISTDNSVSRVVLNTSTINHLRSEYARSD